MGCQSPPEIATKPPDSAGKWECLSAAMRRAKRLARRLRKRTILDVRMKPYLRCELRLHERRANAYLQSKSSDYDSDVNHGTICINLYERSSCSINQ